VFSLFFINISTWRIRQFQALFEMDGVTLYFEDVALEAIAQKAIDKGVGTRGLRGILEEVMGFHSNTVFHPKLVLRV